VLGCAAEKPKQGADRSFFESPGTMPDGGDNCRDGAPPPRRGDIYPRERKVQQVVRHDLHFYRLYLIDSDGHIAKAHQVKAASDDEACELAKLMLEEQSNYPSIEVWDQSRRVAKFLPVPGKRFPALSSPR
jgi:hypothetical protein